MERLLQFSPDLLVAETEALQERRWLGVLHGRVRRARVGDGRRLSLYHLLLLLPDPRTMKSLGTDFRAGVLHRMDPSMPLRGARLRRCILRNPDGGGWRGSGLRLCLLLGRPGLELLEQFFSDWLAGLGLGLTDLGLTLIGRFKRCSSFVARRRVCRLRRQILSAGDRLNCWRRRTGVRLKRRFFDPRSRDVLNERDRISHQ